jgi:hypothetical protein
MEKFSESQEKLKKYLHKNYLTWLMLEDLIFGFG